uniref:Coat protein n=1 Tax=Garlic virus B TaxID=12432 RepID=A0A0H3YGW1_9VIRU|nr:coat protein [Garlic virus B]AKN19948.1 coat protein [Garlic virus B]AKN19951.1 coat protein [Garlic virus B]AKN19952.1 coat protein [Garlic virus B]
MGDRSQGTNPIQGPNAQAQGDGTGGQSQRNPNRNPPPRPQTDLNAQENIMPSENDLAAIAGDVTSNSVATKETVKEILSNLQARRTNATPKDLFSLAWACYHNGSSKFTTLTTDAPCGIPHAELKDLVEDYCTLRQFCGYYAKTCYVTGKQQNKPPSNWSRKGFQEESKFSAFDFFNAVLNDSSPAPPGGMRFKPTQDEILGHSMNAKMSIIESRKASNMVSTRADLLAQQQIHEAPKPLMLTF